MNIPSDYTAKLRKTANTILDSNGDGQVMLTPDTGSQSWLVTRVAVRTNQGATETPFPLAELFDDNTPTQQSSLGATYSGNSDVYDPSSPIQIDPADTLLIVWTGGVPGTTATAIIRGYLKGVY